jgi:hypothetical protein
MWKVRSVIGAALVGLFLVVASGCGKVSKENYDKVEAGMTLSQVEKMLGKGTEKAGVGGAVGNLVGSGRVMTWGDEKRSITITFVNDKVVTKVENGL